MFDVLMEAKDDVCCVIYFITAIVVSTLFPFALNTHCQTSPKINMQSPSSKSYFPQLIIP